MLKIIRLQQITTKLRNYCQKLVFFLEITFFSDVHGTKEFSVLNDRERVRLPHNQTVTPIHLQKITYTSVSFFKHNSYSYFPVNVTLKALSRELGGYLIHFSFFPSPQNCNEKGSRERETTLLLKIFGPNNFCRWGYPVQDVASLLFCSLKSCSWTCPSD